jgi:hypothetical protein
MAVLRGDPAKGPSTMLMKLSRVAGRLRVHTADYELVVLEGTIRHWRAGENEATVESLGAGSYWFQPGGEPHAGSCLSETCVMFITWSGPRDARLSEPRPVQRAQVVIPLKPYLERLRTVPVEIGGDTLDFLLDTGGGVTLISPSLAERLGCDADGRATGFRMRGEKVSTPTCEQVTLQVGGLELRDEAGVFDLMSLIGPNLPRVEGMISLRAFAGRALTLDQRRNELILETKQSLSRRVAGMTPLRARLATGTGGGDLDVFVAAPAARRTLWLLWDSAHLGPVFLAPHALRLLGVSDTLPGGHLDLPLAESLRPRVNYRRADVIYDGVLGDEVISRAVWSVDLATGRMWVGGLEPEM